MSFKDYTFHKKYYGLDFYNIDFRVDNLLDWYHDTIVCGEYTDEEKYRLPREFRDLVEKVAVWYELKYPDYDVVRTIPGLPTDAGYLNRMDLGNISYDDFVKSLSFRERTLLLPPKFPQDTLWIDKKNSFAHVHVDENGVVEEAEGMKSLTKNKFSDEFFEGFTVKEVLDILNNHVIDLPGSNELEEAWYDFAREQNIRSILLDCVMYRLIDRGGQFVGPRRGFMFAKEFGKNIDVPMMYGADLVDPYLRYFANEYIKAGGNPDLECAVGYWQKKSNNDTVCPTLLREVLASQQIKNFPQEEVNFQQKLVDTLATKMPSEDKDKVFVKK